MRRHKQQTGAALIYALLIVAIVVSLSTFIALQTRLSIKTTTRFLNLERAHDAAQLVLAKAMQQLHKRVYHYPLVLIDGELPPFKIQGELIDVQGRFNINNLSQSEYQPLFKRLLILVGMSDENAEHTTSVIAERVKKSFKAEQPVVNVSELESILNPTLYKKLKPILIALPKVTPINVNSAPALVLMGLTSNLSTQKANQLIAERQEQPFTSVEDFLKHANIMDTLTTPISIDSQFFLVKAHVTLGQQETIFYTLLQRTGTGKDTRIITLWQSFNFL